MGLSSNQQSNAFSKFYVISSETNNDLKLTSPILIHKTLLALVGDVKSIKKLNNGNLLIEVLNSKQAENLIKLEKIGNIQVKASPHHTLNHSKGVISESEFQRDLEEDLLDCLNNQNVIAVKRITIKRNGQIFPTKHLILTFNNPTLPKSVKIAYINCPVKPYIPDPSVVLNVKSSATLLQLANQIKKIAPAALFQIIIARPVNLPHQNALTVPVNTQAFPAPVHVIN
ncbi:hypothetical protein AVEN_28269-1 [Araneus ventricosus]|uniref:Uncharacterized protein n=1 Tax=Araneus ventricosus TaxID=182803 RepID=A0A4Y2T255_ARAVE|nr:hypothetical protein AVEN_28269-1 [Araneus ventricosus]